MKLTCIFMLFVSNIIYTKTIIYIYWNWFFKLFFGSLHYIHLDTCLLAQSNCLFTAEYKCFSTLTFSLNYSQLGGFICTCQPGWTGIKCNSKLGFCSSEPCLNFGRCVDDKDGFHCVCYPGFEGSSWCRMLFGVKLHELLSLVFWY